MTCSDLFIIFFSSTTTEMNNWNIVFIWVFDNNLQTTKYKILHLIFFLYILQALACAISQQISCSKFEKNIVTFPVMVPENMCIPLKLTWTISGISFIPEIDWLDPELDSNLDMSFKTQKDEYFGKRTKVRHHYLRIDSYFCELAKAFGFY